MRLFPISFLLMLSITFAACSNADTSQKAASESAKSSETSGPSYRYVSDSTYVGFVAYKFTEKAGVPGWFENFEAEGVPTEISSAEDLIKNLRFSIPVSSLETGIADRNQKIRQHFFDTIDTDLISGEVLSAENGKAKVLLTLNNLSKETTLDYAMEGNTFHLRGTIDVEIWDALSGIDALNKACDILHKGADGVSKLWSTVDLDIRTVLVAN